MSPRQSVVLSAASNNDWCKAQCLLADLVAERCTLTAIQHENHMASEHLEAWALQAEAQYVLQHFTKSGLR